MTSSHPPSDVFVDSGAFYALIAPADANHQPARLIQAQLAEHRTRLYTTNFIRDEAYTLILARVGYQSAIAFLDTLAVSSFNLIRLTVDDESAAEAILRTHSDKRYSYTDATSFAVMDRLQLRYAFAFDHNFEQYGKLLLPP